MRCHLFQISGRKAEITSQSCDEFGIRILQFSQPKGTPYYFSKPSAKDFGAQPHLNDLLSTKYIFLNESELYPLAGNIFREHAYMQKSTMTTVIEFI